MKCVVSCTLFPGDVQVWSFESGQENAVLVGHNAPISAMRVMDFGPRKTSILVSGDVSGTLMVSWPLCMPPPPPCPTSRVDGDAVATQAWSTSTDHANLWSYECHTEAGTCPVACLSGRFARQMNTVVVVVGLATGRVVVSVRG